MPYFKTTFNISCWSIMQFLLQLVQLKQHPTKLPLKRKTYQSLSKNTLEPREKKEEQFVPEPTNSKYKVTLEFKGTADSQQVEEEIITILKGQFLSKLSTDIHLPQALQLLPSNKEGGTKE